MIILQFFILISINISLFLWTLYGIHLHYKEKIEEALKAIEDDYKDEVFDKRTYRKHIEKLLQERDSLQELVSYMKLHARDSRIYKKYFLINNKNEISNT